MFCKKYSSIGSIHVFLPQVTPVIALLASLTRRVTCDIVKKLQFTCTSYLHRNLGNDQSNISLIVRAIHNTMNSYLDLDFMIPPDTSDPTHIKKTWIYANNVTVGAAIIDHLRTLLLTHLRSMICLYIWETLSLYYTAICYNFGQFYHNYHYQFLASPPHYLQLIQYNIAKSELIKVNYQAVTYFSLLLITYNYAHLFCSLGSIFINLQVLMYYEHKLCT